jgi:hypothetical protein
MQLGRHVGQTQRLTDRSLRLQGLFDASTTASARTRSGTCSNGLRLATYRFKYSYGQIGLISEWVRIELCQ